MQQPMPKEINCLNFKGLFAFLEKHYGDWGINTVTDGLVDNPRYMVSDINDPSRVFPITPSQLVDLNYWVSNDFSVKLLHNVTKVVKADNPLFEAGRGAVRESLSKHAIFIGKLFGPTLLAKKATNINARFNRTKKVLLNKLSGKELAFELCYYPQFEVTKEICNWNLGIYTELLHASGVKGIFSEEVKCILDGDACCEFRLKWKKSGIFTRTLKGLSIWQLKKEVRNAVEEYEGLLRERDRLINELTSSEKKYRSLFENTATANAILDSNLTITLVNSGFEDLVGQNERQIIGKLNFRELIKPSDYSTVRSFILNDSDSDQSFLNNLEFCLVTAAGTEKEVICKIGRIPDTMNRIASMIDVTEMKHAQKEKIELKSRLIRSEKMEALGLLAGGVAHDLNNVLSGIVSYPELLLLDLPEESHLRKPIETIKDSGVKASAIVQDLLTLARRDIAEKEVVNLNEIISGYLESPEYEKMTSFHPGVRLTFEPEQSLLNIHGVPFNLSKVVMNLITNASEAIQGDGAIRVTTKTVYLDQPISGYAKFQEGEYVSLTVSDSGVGIAKEDIERIFEPFYSRKVMGRSGTGLGMTVVWGTVVDHDGHIDVISEVGKGTTFEMIFPATKEGIKEHEASVSIKDITGNGESILVVDDVREQRHLASSILTRLGYSVSTASSGEAAVALVKSGDTWDLVILDMIMHSGIDGLETYRQIRKIKPDQKAIIVSGFSETNRVRNAQFLGAGAYIRKPYHMEKIGMAVKAELNK